MKKNSIRLRVYLFLGVFLLAACALEWRALSNFRITSNNMDNLALANDHRSETASLRLKVLQLQNKVRIHSESGESGIARRIEIQYLELRDYLTLAISQGERTELEILLLERMSAHVDTYYENFEFAAKESSLRLSSIHDVLLPEIKLQNEILTTELIKADPDFHDSLAMAETIRQLRQAHLNISEFLLRPDYEVVSEVTSEFIEVKAALGNRLLDISGFPEYAGPLRSLLTSIETAESTFLDIVNSIRGYLMLANVNMAGAANEFINLADELDLLAENRQIQVFENSRSQARILQNWALLLFVIFLAMTLFAVIGLNQYLIRPIVQLTSTFRNLSEGKLVTHIPDIRRRDEFGDLAIAADVFREKNLETTALLDKASMLVNQLESQNKRLEAEVIERKNGELKLLKQSEELSRSNADLAQFAHVASHDLQEPLRMVASYLQLISKRYRNSLDSDGVEFIDFAVDGAFRMQALIRSLLEYSRIGTNGNDFSVVDCNSALDGAKKNLQLVIEETQTSITGDTLPEIIGDEVQITMLFQNLIANSIRYRGEESPKIEVRTEIKDGVCLISISDNGIGFKQEYADRVFVIFQRLHAREMYPESTGIGLSVCKRIAERHGGKIWAESAEGTGSTLYFTAQLAHVSNSENTGVEYERLASTAS